MRYHLSIYPALVFFRQPRPWIDWRRDVVCSSEILVRFLGVARLQFLKPIRIFRLLGAGLGEFELLHLLCECQWIVTAGNGRTQRSTHRSSVRALRIASFRLSFTLLLSLLLRIHHVLIALLHHMLVALHRHFLLHGQRALPLSLRICL